jgi:hypothetical protein
VIFEAIEDVLEVFSIAWYVECHSDDGDEMVNFRLFKLLGESSDIGINAVLLVGYQSELSRHRKVGNRHVDRLVDLLQKRQLFIDVQPLLHLPNQNRTHLHHLSQRKCLQLFLLVNPKP